MGVPLAGATRLATTTGSRAEPPAAHARSRSEELADLEDTVLQEVAEPTTGDKRDGIGRLDVLREEKYADVRVLVLDRKRGTGAFVGEGRRHADVEDDQVRLDALHRPGTPVAVGRAT